MATGLVMEGRASVPLVAVFRVFPRFGNSIAHASQHVVQAVPVEPALRAGSCPGRRLLALATEQDQVGRLPYFSG